MESHTNILKWTTYTVFGPKQMKALRYFRCHLFFPSSYCLVSVPLPKGLHTLYTKTVKKWTATIAIHRCETNALLLSKRSICETSVLVCVLADLWIWSFHQGAKIVHNITHDMTAFFGLKVTLSVLSEPLYSAPPTTHSPVSLDSTRHKHHFCSLD